MELSKPNNFPQKLNRYRVPPYSPRQIQAQTSSSDKLWKKLHRARAEKQGNPHHSPLRASRPLLQNVFHLFVILPYPAEKHWFAAISFCITKSFSSYFPALLQYERVLLVDERDTGFKFVSEQQDNAAATARVVQQSAVSQKHNGFAYVRRSNRAQVHGLYNQNGPTGQTNRLR